MASRDVSVKLKADITGFVAGLATASRSASQFSTGLNQGAVKGGQGFTALSTGALAVGAAAAAGLGLAVSKFAEFDQAMSQVEAATHASASTMDQLRAAALEAGASTVFSATEAAQGVTALAKAGVSAADILGGGLAGALSLAAAGELDVGSAAEIAATALTQFNLSGAEIPHVADLLAAGAGKAQGEVTDMAAALNQAGLVASQMGLSIEETTGTLAAFASAGLIGSDAGTSFRTMLLRLANPSDEAAGLMKDLGISAYDAQGNFVGMENVAGQLRDKLGGLTQAQRDSTLATIFGSDAIRGANVLYNQGAGGIASWTSKVDDSGYAAETAALKTDNLAGDLERLGGAFDTALIGAGSSANDTLRLLTQTATGLVDAFASLPGPVQSVAVGLLAVVAATGLVGGAYGLAAPKIAIANAALIATGPAGALASKGLGLAAKAAGVAGIAMAAYALLQNATREGLGEIQSDGNVASTTLLDIADSGRVTRDSLVALGAETSNFDELMTQTFHRNAGDNIAAFIDQTDDAVDEATRFFASTDAGLAALVSSGRGDDAARVFDTIATEAAKSGVTVEQVAAALPGYAAAIAQSMDAAQKALSDAVESGSAEDLASAITAAQQAIEIGGLSASEAAAQFPELSTAMALLAAISPDLSNKVNGVALSIADTGLSADQVGSRLDALKLAMDRLAGGAVTATQAQGNFTLSLAAMGDALTANGASFDVNTTAGANNYNSLVGVASAATDAATALYEQAAASGDSAAGYAAFTGSLEVSRGALEATLVSMGVSADEAHRLATEVIGIPTVAEVDAVLNDGVSAPLDQAARDRDSNIVAYASADSAERILNNTARDRTSTVYQSTVTTASKVGYNADGGYLAGYAGGGAIRGPGTGRSDSITGVFPSGARIGVSNGEFIINAADTTRNRAALEAGNRGAKLMIAPGYAGGGLVGSRTSGAAGPISVGAPTVKVFFDGEPFRGMMRVEIQQSDDRKQVRARAGQRVSQ